MFVKLKISKNSISGDTINLNIPIDQKNDTVDKGELIERVFFDNTLKNSINPILDYDKVSFQPIYKNEIIPIINFNLNILVDGFIPPITSLSNVGFTDNDVRSKLIPFTNSFLNLSFYDGDNNLTNNIISEIDIYTFLTQDNLYPIGVDRPFIAGQPLPASQIPLKFVTANRLFVKNYNYEGYNIYTYKDDLEIGGYKYLYVSATFFNGKNGKTYNLVTKNEKVSVSDLQKNRYFRVKLSRTETGFFYEFDETYSNNYTFSENQKIFGKYNLDINLYDTQVL